MEEGEAELLLTCLDRIASPVIRFRTRDRVRIVPAGSYGERRPLRGIRCGAVDRFDDMLKIRGNNVWPAQLNGALLGHGAVADYRADVFLERADELFRLAPIDVRRRHHNPRGTVS